MNIIDKINKIDQLFEKSVSENGHLMVECLDEAVTKSYFIRKLSGQFNPDWFEFAYGQNILSFSDIPEPTLTESQGNPQMLGFKNWEGAFPIVEAAKNLRNYPEFSGLLLDIINRYIELANSKKGDQTWNFTVDYHIARSIIMLPIELLEQKHLEFIFDIGLRRDRSLLSRELLGTFYFRVLDYDRSLAMQLLDRFFTPVFEKRLHRAHSIVDDYALESFSKKAPEILYAHFGDDVVKWAVDKLKQISEEHKFMFSKIELTSLEPDTQNANETDFNFSITRLVIGLVSMMPSNELEGMVKHMINLEDQIVSRIGFYLIDRNYRSLGYLFFQQENPLNRFEAKLEIYRLITRNCEEFNDEQVRCITGWIQQLEVDKSDGETDEQSRQYRAYRQLEWYMALEPIHYRFSELLIKPYNDLKEITEGSQPSHPGYDSYFTVRHGGDYSESNRIADKSVVELLNILANRERWDGYNIYGLQQDLRDYVISATGEVTKNFDKFQSLPVQFIFNFIDAFRGMAEKGSTIDISELFAFLRAMVENRNDLWDLSVEGRDKSNSIGMIAWTVKTIVRNNDYNLTIDQIKHAVRTLIVMESKYTGDFKISNSEPVNDISNSARGNIYDAMIVCSIREVKVTGGLPFWDQDVKDVFTKRVAEKSGSVEFYWSLGFNVPQISYLDMEWLVNYKDFLVEVQEGKYQLPVFYGYLLFSSQLYTNLYNLFYPTYLSQIDTEIENKTIVRRLVEHVWVAFAIDLSKSGSLLDRVMNSADVEKVAFLIDRIKIEHSQQLGQKIRYVWREILSNAEVSTNKSFVEKAFEMVYFLELLTDISKEDLDIFKRTISLGKADVNTYRLVKIVDAAVNAGSYDLAGQLLRILLEDLSEDAYFDESKLIEIIETLYSNGMEQYADKISIAAVNRRNFGAVTIYNKYHQI